MTFKDIFPGLSRTLSFNFQDFPGPKWFSRTFQGLEFSRKKPGLSRRHGNPDKNVESPVPKKSQDADPTHPTL